MSIILVEIWEFNISIWPFFGNCDIITDNQWLPHLPYQIGLYWPLKCEKWLVIHQYFWPMKYTNIPYKLLIRISSTSLLSTRHYSVFVNVSWQFWSDKRVQITSIKYTPQEIIWESVARLSWLLWLDWSGFWVSLISQMPSFLRSFLNQAPSKHLVS